MNNSMEMDTAQNKAGCVDTDDHSLKECGPEKDSVHSGPAETSAWAGSTSDVSLPYLVRHPHQHAVQPGMVDPLTLRVHCPCQSPQCHLPYPDYLLESHSSQYHLLTGPVARPPDSSHQSSVSAPWFSHEPVFCSMLPGDLYPPLGSICVPQAMDQQQFQEGQTEFTSHITQPVMCNVSGDGQAVLFNPCEPGPMFLTPYSESAHRDDSLTQGKDVSVMENPSQYHQMTCPLYESRDQTARIRPSAPPTRAVSRKRCHCTRSQCLKLYCECFANGLMCSNCDCSNCHNNTEHEMKRHEAIKSCLGRNPDAFRSKIAGGETGKVKGWHNKGCNCKRSGCLKNYCECYEANIKCTSSCKCVGCRNYDDASEMGLKEKADKWAVSVITPAVVEDVCGCLLLQAQKAEMEAWSQAQSEHMVLEEFGHCLTLIVKAMFQ